MMYCDTRLGGIERWYLERPDDYMQIPEESRKCVAFVAYEMADGSARLAGTVFFVARPITADLSFVYAITAKHVLDGIKKLGLDMVLLRLNKKNGASFFVRIPLEAWRFHPTDSSIDVAIVRVSLSDFQSDHMAYPIDGFATAALAKRQQVGIGDDVFVVGLFVHHFGMRRNIPIARIGNIAAMPEEKIDSGLGEIDAYLVETRSIAGLSGSPVFLNPGLHRLIDGKICQNDTAGKSFYLLGIMHADIGNKLLPAGDPFREHFNVGISIVVPADKILEVLNQPFVIRYEAEAKENMRKAKLPVMDSNCLPE